MHGVLASCQHQAVCKTMLDRAIACLEGMTFHLMCQTASESSRNHVQDQVAIGHDQYHVRKRLCRENGKQGPNGVVMSWSQPFNERGRLHSR